MSLKMYSIVYTREAKHAIDKLTNKVKLQVKTDIEHLADDPVSGKSLTHELKGLWSYRCGVYRIIYRIHHHEVTVMILTVGHRKDVYEKLSRRIG
jgi:mRNA interferase RelE/StbE